MTGGGGEVGKQARAPVREEGYRVGWRAGRVVVEAVVRAAVEKASLA